MKIKHNLSSINANNFLEISVRKQEGIIEKLSSGYRINKAGDDAAGLAISEKMRSQIRGLNQASRNSQDGISLIQTAEGALDEVHSMLQRMHQLSVQAANGDHTNEDRDAIQKEIDELVKEIDSISSRTEFNNMKLLDGTMADKTSSINSSNLMQVNESGSSMTLQQLLSSKSKNLNIVYMNETDNFETTKSTVGNSTAAGCSYLKNVLQTQMVPQAVKGVLNAFSPAFNYLSSSSIGIGLKLYSDAASTTLASVSVGFSTNGLNKVDSSMLTYQLAVNMASLHYKSNGELTDESRKALETTIVHEMVHGFMDESLTNGMIGVTNGVYDTRYAGSQSNYTKSANSYPTWFKEGMAQAAAGGYSNYNDWVNGGLGIDTNTSKAYISSVVKNSNNSLTSGSVSSKYGTGYLACMYIGYLASGGSSVTAASISNGLGKVLSDMISGKSLETVINERTNGKYANLSDFESKFGDTDSSSFIYQLTQMAGDTGNGALVTGNLLDNDLLPDMAASISLFSLDVTNDTVKNIYPSGINVLSGGSRTTGGTVPVGDYGSTITEGPGSNIGSGSTIDLGNISSISGINYDNTNNVLTITNSGNYTIKGVGSNIRVVVNNGVKANVTLDNTTINSNDGAGINLQGNAELTLNLQGVNKITTSKAGSAGIRCTTGANLIIQGNGVLTSENKYHGSLANGGAGIGGGYGEDGGIIKIAGGTIIANGGKSASGIGGGYGGAAGNISIDGTNVIIKATGSNAPDIGAGENGSGGTVTKTRGIIFEGTNGSVYGNVTLNNTLNCDGKNLSVLSGSTLNVLNGGKIINCGNLTNSGTIENHGIIGSVLGAGTTHHYVSSISKNLIQPSNAIVGQSLADSVAALPVSTINISYNGTTKTLTGTWSVADKSGNPITNLSGTTIGENESYIYTVKFASEDGIYFDPSNISSYKMESSNLNMPDNKTISNENVSELGPGGGGSTLTYSYMVSTSPSEAFDQAGGIKIQVGAKAHQTIDITIESTKSSDLGIANLSVLTKDDADKAMDACDKAIKKVSEVRGSLGARQNRLERAMNSIDNTEENLQSAESRIRDLDIAKGVMEYSKYKVLMQTGQAMLAQANQATKDVLFLLA